MFISEERLTPYSLSESFIDQCKNRYDFSHNLDDQFYHFIGGLFNLSINLNSFHKGLNAFKDVDQSLGTFFDITRYLVMQDEKG